MKEGWPTALLRPRHFLPAFALTLLIAAVLVGAFFDILERQQREAEYQQLAAMAELKAGQIENWLVERRNDLEALAASRELRRDIRHYLDQNTPAAARRLRQRFESSSVIEHATGLELLDALGLPALTIGLPGHDLNGLIDWQAQSDSGFRTLFADLHRNGPSRQISFSFIAPLRDEAIPEAPATGYVRLSISPERFLYPLLRNGPSAGSSGETFLIRRDGEDILYLSDVRYLPDAALNLRHPLAASELASTRAMRTGDGETFPGLDYRQEAVLAASRPIAGTPWVLVTKKDEKEVFAELERLRLASLAVVLTSLLAGGMLWRQVWLRQSERAGQALKARIAAIAANIPGVLCAFRLRPDGRISFPYAGPGISELYGLSPEELARDAAPLFGRLHPDDLVRIRQSFVESAKTLAQWHEEFRILHPQRGEIWIEGRSTPRREADGSVLWQGCIQEVTLRRQAEERYRTLLANIPGVAFRSELKRPWRMSFVSDGILALTGYPVGEFLRPGGMTCGDLLVDEDIARIEAAVQQGIATRNPYQVEYRMRCADGQVRWVHEKGQVIFGDDGQPRWLDGVLIDITVRIEAESALQASSERWRQLAEAMPQLVWSSLPDGRCDYVNQCWRDYTGLLEADRLDQAWLMAVHPEDRARLAAAWSQALAAKEAFDGEYRLRRGDGEYRWFKTRVQPVLDRSGRLTKWYGSSTDIQELKEFESALHRSLLRQQGLHQLDRAILEASTPQEIAAKGLAHLATMLSFLHGNARSFDFNAGTAPLLACLSTDATKYEPGQQVSLASFGQKDLADLDKGQVCVIHDLGTLSERPPVLDSIYRYGACSYLRLPLIAEGRLVGSLNLMSERVGAFGNAEVETARPIADVLAIALQQAFLRQHLADQASMLERRVAERTAELARMKEKAEAANRAKSQFLANMAHELRTPLNSLMILSQLLADNAQENLTPEQVGFARVIHDAGNDLLTLINDILDLSKIESGRAAVESVELLFLEILDFVERTFRPQAASKRLQLELSLAEDLPPRLFTDPTHLHPILRNLMANAIKFTQAGRVCLQVRQASGGWTSGHPVLSRTRTVVAFVVTDTGIGIPAAKLPLIFDAFEQADTGTARRLGGAGLGLHIARTNAALLGGELTVSSVPGEGSTFTLFLPLDYRGPAILETPAPATIAAIPRVPFRAVP